jgi:hypothetical protein
MTTRVANLKVWAALVVGAVSAAIAVAIIGVALDAGTAVAATPTRATIEETQFTVAPDTRGEAFAVCPGTKRVVGGGVVQSGSANRLSVLASGPLDATGVTLNTDDGDVAKQWYAAVGNFSGAERTFRVYALCSGASDATIKETQFTVAPDTTGEAFAVCPGTKRVVGGGVVQSGSARRLWVRASGPLDATGFTLNTDDGDVAKQWYAAVLNGDDTERTLRVFALCSDASDATIEETQFTTDSTEAFAVCPGTKRALGGGVVQSGSANRLPDVRASGPLDSTGFTLNTDDGDKAKQWYAAVSNFLGTTDRTFRVFGICE